MTFTRLVPRARLVALALAVPATVLIGQQQAAASPAAGTYSQVNLVSDLPGVAAVTDPHLVNPWGMSASPTSPIWISDNGTGVSTLYDGNGVPFPPKPNGPLVVRIGAPSSAGAGATSAPTGQVFNGTPGFVVSKRGASGPALFIFATEDGTISGWNPGVDRLHAVITVDRSTATDSTGDTGAVYKGLALATTPGGTFLYATNFRFGQVEVFDSSFHLTGTFTDPTVPAGFAPFGIHSIGGLLYVTYAKQNAAKHDDLAGPGSGFVDAVNPADGTWHRVASGSSLNSPWAVVQAPAGFGAFAGDLLIGNFGDGRINAFAPATGRHLGSLHNPAGQSVVIPGLWDLRFGNGAHDADPNWLYFTAGIAEEAHGLFGYLAANA